MSDKQIGDRRPDAWMYEAYIEKSEDLKEATQTDRGWFTKITPWHPSKQYDEDQYKNERKLDMRERWVSDVRDRLDELRNEMREKHGDSERIVGDYNEEFRRMVNTERGTFEWVSDELRRRLPDTDTDGDS